MKSFKNKVAVITGAGSGIGRHLAILLKEAGASVAICDINEETLVETNRIRQRLTTDAEDGRILEAIGRLSDLDISIDDNPVQTVTEMRAKAKRLQKERGLQRMHRFFFLQMVTMNTKHYIFNSLDHIHFLLLGRYNFFFDGFFFQF